MILAGALLGAPAWAAQRGGDQNSRPNTPGTGPYPAMKEEIPALPRHVVYRPANVPAMGAQKLGVVAWGNGGCSDDAASARFHLLELASHGYLVSASGRMLSGPGGTYSEPNGGAAGPVAVAWLNWQFRGDAKAATRFVGEQCGLCTDAKWTFERKHFPTR
jgi:hypothetical protein